MNNDAPLPAKNPFEYRRPSDEQVGRIRVIRGSCQRLALDIYENCLPSRERSLALTKLEEVSMWANKAVVFEDS